ncbi:hypothetical protein CEXT_480521 [Caerostris extrusa]|uniref:Uncharacterized protein n=1 Tax=Caerostris extrusa TaxID=172846 RepID=A0AAV4SZK3_CAEEX|nr:hypothetical protein CEXT_480521 [Caerostris extrusa]
MEVLYGKTGDSVYYQYTDERRPEGQLASTPAFGTTGSREPLVGGGAGPRITFRGSRTSLHDEDTGM